MQKHSNYLGLSDKKQTKIVKHLIDKAETVKQLVDVHRSQLFLDYSYHYDPYRQDLSICRKPNLKSISGIEELSFMNPKWLFFYRNPSLTSINLDHIFKHFQKLDTIYLGQNNLNKIDATFLPSNLVLDIRGNQLSREQIKTLESLATLPWYKKMYNISISKYFPEEKLTFKSTLAKLLITWSIHGIPSVIMGVYAGFKIQDKFQLDDPETFFVNLVTTMPLYLALEQFDFYRFKFPYKPAEIVGADEQK
jgi:hypothetical protein